MHQHTADLQLEVSQKPTAPSKFGIAILLAGLPFSSLVGRILEGAVQGCAEGDFTHWNTPRALLDKPQALHPES